MRQELALGSGEGRSQSSRFDAREGVGRGPWRRSLKSPAMHVKAILELTPRCA